MPTASSSLPIAKTVADGAVVPGYLNITGVYWYNPAASADTVVLQDDLGNVIWAGRCESANQSQFVHFPTPIDVTGYKVSQISSGTLYIYKNKL